MTTQWDAEPSGLSRPEAERLPLPPDRLPEVAELVAEGWVLAPDAPVWAFLPAIWPPKRRTWVVDRSTRYADSYEISTGGVVRAEHAAMSVDDVAEIERDRDDLAAAAGCPGRPHDRLWLLRSVAGHSPDQVCDLVARRVGPAGFFASPQLGQAGRACLADLMRDEVLRMRGAGAIDEAPPDAAP